MSIIPSAPSGNSADRGMPLAQIADRLCVTEQTAAELIAIARRQVAA